MNNPKTYLALIFLTAFLLTACASNLPPAPSELHLSETSWVLLSIDENDQVGEVIGSEPVTLNFASESEVNGFGGCNSYSGSYDPDTQTASISFTDIVSTMIACEDAAVMNAETLFFEGLNTAASFEVSSDAIPVTGDRLTITGGGHTLVFVSL
jgi:heat shock protein HslJ